MPLAQLIRHSEPYAPTGSIGDSGFRKLLGTPTLDMLQVVVREALQNSCDAAKLGRGPEVMIGLRRLTPDQAHVLRNQVLWDLPEATASRAALDTFREDEAPVVLEICDFGTTGLGGPTRADRIPTGATQTDFIDFLRNVGTSRDTRHGGGTYGFGKVSFYAASSCSTILVDSQPSNDTRRLMGCHLGPAFSKSIGGDLSRTFTGRHWWGIEGEDDILEPLSGERAGMLADALGFPQRDSGRTGTSIMVFGPHLGDDTLEVAAYRIAETVLWNFWPRMMADVPPERRLNFKLLLEGEAIPVPAPEAFPPLDLFCKAMRKVRSGDPDCKEIICQRPQKTLGRLAIVKGIRADRTPLVGEGSLMPETSSHIAVMRPVELVVRCYAGEPLPSEKLEWAGVFVVDDDDDVERAFAHSEPPAHDDWLPGSMPKGHAKTFVNVGVREIRRAAASVAAPVTSVNAGGQDVSLAKVAGIMGRALDGSMGEGAGPPRPGKGGKGGTKKARASRPVFLNLEMTDDGMMAVFETTVSGVTPQDGLVLLTEASLAMDGATWTDPEADAMPFVREIRADGMGTIAMGGRARLDNGAGRYQIVVSMLSDAAAIVTARLEADDAE